MERKARPPTVWRVSNSGNGIITNAFLTSGRLKNLQQFSLFARHHCLRYPTYLLTDLLNFGGDILRNPRKSIEKLYFFCPSLCTSCTHHLARIMAPFESAIYFVAIRAGTFSKLYSGSLKFPVPVCFVAVPMSPVYGYKLYRSEIWFFFHPVFSLT